MAEHVASIDDPRLADYRHVGDPRWLREQGLFVAEGRLIVQRAVEHRRLRIKSILATPAAYAAMVPQNAPAPIYVAPQQILDAVTGINFHRGSLAIVHRPQERAVGDLVTGTRLLAIEGVGNPDNVGGLFRAAAAFGVDGILLDPSSGDPFYRKAVRTSMGSTLSVPFARDPGWPAALAICRAACYRVLALTPRATAKPIGSVRVAPADRLLVMVGGEGAGLTEGAMDLADLQVRIPTTDAVDSLNVTVAAGIALAFLR